MKIRLLFVLLPFLMLLAACDDDDPAGPNDVTSPAKVTNLAVISTGDSSFTLRWTAPGDDGGAGTAASYQIRWSHATITSANFGSANVVPNPPAPAAGGTTQQFTVTELDTMLVTHFALRAKDEAGNVSAVSNDAASPLRAMVDIPPSRDNTMFEEGDTLSNGAGAYLFTGTTNGLNTGGIGKIRRALLAFAVSDSIPAGAVIDSVLLTVHISKIPNSIARVTSLHRVTADWGEGASNAGNPGGQGILAEANDATWTFRFYNTTSWTSPGGDFVATVSAQTNFATNNSFPVWTSEQMANDVQSWLDTPGTNFGWIVIGDEPTQQSAKRFDSRENVTANFRPRLRVFYTVTP